MASADSSRPDIRRNRPLGNRPAAGAAAGTGHAHRRRDRGARRRRGSRQEEPAGTRSHPGRFRGAGRRRGTDDWLVRSGSGGRDASGVDRGRRRHACAVGAGGRRLDGRDPPGGPGRPAGHRARVPWPEPRGAAPCGAGGTGVRRRDRGDGELHRRVRHRLHAAAAGALHEERRRGPAGAEGHGQRIESDGRRRP